MWVTNIDLALSLLESPSNQILKSISNSNYTGMSCWVTLEICEELKWSCHKNQSQSYNIWNGNKFAVTFIKSFPFHCEITLQPPPTNTGCPGDGEPLAGGGRLRDLVWRPRLRLLRARGRGQPRPQLGGGGQQPLPLRGPSGADIKIQPDWGIHYTGTGTKWPICMTGNGL